MIDDRRYLLSEQYRDAANLNARIELHRRFSTNRYGWQRWVFDHFDLPPHARILELGCGPGDLWRENLDRLPSGWDLILSDLSPGMLEQARLALTGAGIGPLPRLKVIDAQSIPYADASFDAVIANHMLYHVPDRAAALAEIRRVLRPEGRFYAATVGEQHLADLRDLIRPATQRESSADVAGQAFGLENGAAQLAPWFDIVERRNYVDSLVVTEAGPLIAFILSSRRWLGLPDTDDAVERVARLVQQRLAADGAIHIRKSSGLFVCRAG